MLQPEPLIFPEGVRFPREDEFPAGYERERERIARAKITTGFVQRDHQADGYRAVFEGNVHAPQLWSAFRALVEALLPAAIDASGGAESWAQSPSLRALMIRSVQAAKSPIFFLQSANDYDTSPTKVLSAAMRTAGKNAQVKIYSPFGHSAREGHSFAYAGSDVWFPDVLTFVKTYCTGRAP